MNSDMVWQMVRYLLLMAGPSLAANGIATQTEWTTVVGVIIAGLTFVWGCYVKWSTRSVPAAVAEKPGALTVHAVTGGTVVNSHSWLAVLLFLPMLMAIAGCGAMSLAGSAAGFSVSQNDLDVARSGYDAGFLSPAATYRSLPLCGASQKATLSAPCASRSLVLQLQADDRAVSSAFNSVQAAITAGNNSGALAAYQTLKTAIATAEALIPQTKSAS